MPARISADSVIVSKLSFDSDDPYDIVGSNISFLNALFEEHLRHDEVSADALRSYYVDYYNSEVNNGGFSQFVYNSRWAKDVVGLVRKGLQAIDATKHLVLFDKATARVKELGKKHLRAYLESDYFGDNPVRDKLNAPNDEFFRISRREELTARNSAWLRQLPNLVLLTVPQMKKEVKWRASAVPDREERIANAEAAELDDPEAQFQIARQLEEGDGIKKNNRRAFEHYQKAADQGHQMALAFLGVCFQRGTGTDKDLKRGFQCFLKAAKRGLPLAMHLLGECNLEGRGTKSNPEEGIKWYRRGVKVGDLGCTAELADCYEFGKGVRKDLHEAIRLYELCMEGGFDAVKPALKRAKQQMKKSTRK